jgi:hypothetical protein
MVLTWCLAAMPPDVGKSQSGRCIGLCMKILTIIDVLTGLAAKYGIDLSKVIYRFGNSVLLLLFELFMAAMNGRNKIVITSLSGATNALLHGGGQKKMPGS